MSGAGATCIPVLFVLPFIQAYIQSVSSQSIEPSISSSILLPQRDSGPTCPGVGAEVWQLGKYAQSASLQSISISPSLSTPSVHISTPIPVEDTVDVVIVGVVTKIGADVEVEDVNVGAPIKVGGVEEMFMIGFV